MTTTERKTTLVTEDVFTLTDCETAARLAKCPEIAGKLHEYVVTSPLWPKLEKIAAPRHLGRFIVTNFLLPLTYEFVRAHRAGRAPDDIKLARVWRKFALQCSDGSTSEIPDASERDLQRWLPGKQKPREWRTVVCIGCKRHIRVRFQSDLTKCKDCRFPGMGPKRASTKTGKSKKQALEAA
jgi:hypothetical protein